MENIRGFRRRIYALPVGIRVGINTINLSARCVMELRELIKTGVLEPVENDVKEIYKDVVSVMSGDVILPQCDYIKRSDVFKYDNEKSNDFDIDKMRRFLTSKLLR